MDRIGNIYEVTKRLCGMINPQGDSSIDEIRYQNLIDTIDVAERLLLDIHDVSKKINSHEHSVHKAGKEAADFLNRLQEFNY